MNKTMSSEHKATRIKVIGLGRSGVNAVRRMRPALVAGMKLICVDTEALTLEADEFVRTLQLGDSGLGAANPDKGRHIAEQSAADICKVMDDAQIIFIITGLGGGTGTGAAPVIARLARQMGIRSVGVVTTPYNWETGKRQQNAAAGLAELASCVDSLLVLPLDMLLDMQGDAVTQDEAFAHANNMLKLVVNGLAANIKPGFWQKTKSESPPQDDTICCCARPQAESSHPAEPSPAGCSRLCRPVETPLPHPECLGGKRLPAAR